jgi:hypothetical protein
MNFSPKLVTLVTLVATTQLIGSAYAQGTKAPTAPVVQHSPARATIPTKAPEDWIIYDDTTYAPVLDDVSRHLQAARRAFDAKDTRKAALEMRAVAEELKRQAAGAFKEDAALVKSDKALLAEDTKYEQDNIKRMNAGALTISSAAAAIESGQIKTQADLDKAIDVAARADLDRRWLVADVTTWYPVTEEPQRHFTNAMAGYARKDYRSAATDIRKATSYLRLEAGRATGEAKREIDSSVVELDSLAASVEKGAVKDEPSMPRVFARASHALALEHRSKAAESWARKDYDRAGYELKAASFGLECAVNWSGREAKAGASATVAETRALGDKLISGGAWTRDEVDKGFESLAHGIDALGQKLGITTKASPFIAGA